MNAASVAQRGYAPLYHQGETNRCPGCSRTAWHVGRSSAECAGCGTALPLQTPSDRKVAPCGDGQ